MRKILVRVASAVVVTAGILTMNYVSKSEPSTKSNFNPDVVAEIPRGGNLHAELQVFNFKEAVNEADLIVKVQIANKKEEYEKPVPKTLFGAHPIEVIKGDESLLNQEINILQHGNKDWTFNENKLFDLKEEYIFFLKKAVGDFEPNTFWILGEETGMYKILPNGLIEKQALYEKDLAEIEDKKITIDRQQLNIFKEVQVLFEDKLKEKIRDTK